MRRAVPFLVIAFGIVVLAFCREKPLEAQMKYISLVIDGIDNLSLSSLHQAEEIILGLIAQMKEEQADDAGSLDIDLFRRAMFRLEDRRWSIQFAIRLITEADADIWTDEQKQYLKYIVLDDKAICGVKLPFED